MYILTKEQKVSNLEEIIVQKNQKIVRLQEEVQNLTKKLEKIKSQKETKSPIAPEINQDFHKEEPSKSTTTETNELNLF